MEDFVVMNGGIRVPIGYRFLPTDEELVHYYLKRKVLALPLPPSIIPDHFDVFNSDPWTLPGDLEEKRYFFGKRNDHIIESGNKCKIGAGSGYWRKCNGKTKQIYVDPAGGTKQVVGVRTTLVFRQGKRAQTGWLMREYRLVMGTRTTTTVTTATTKPNSTTQSDDEMGFGDWVVYCIFQRKKKTKKHGSSSSSSPAAVSHHHDLSKSTSVDFAIEETDFFTTTTTTPLQPCVSANCLSEVTVETISSIGFDEEVMSSTAAAHNNTSSSPYYMGN
ncbi:hypothetical protein Dsin_011306 [Dipteronia sinensis]|uniref:NAC domain-containing protein n=1 Tax=Dipteronia sinensis TaxID=43782 RepID=A0AAE0AU04_9ROSI|nr:hypothetical protein Dsin_011306 [Dipteronia sinensis]